MTQQYPTRAEIFQWLKANNAQPGHVLTYYSRDNAVEQLQCTGLWSISNSIVMTTAFNAPRSDTSRRNILPVQLIDVPFLREPHHLCGTLLVPVRVIATWEQPKEETWEEKILNWSTQAPIGDLLDIFKAFARDMDRKYGGGK